jgi:uncharacterized protein (TIGR00369 family)
MGAALFEAYRKSGGDGIVDRQSAHQCGFTHGGLIASLADNAMGYSCAQATGWTTSYVTVSLAVDYVGSGQIGQWLAVEGEVIKTGSTFCFAQCLVKADDVVIARANATFRVVPKPKAWPKPNE